MVMLKLEEQPPLIQAIFSGEIDDVKNLLDGKVDVNYQDAEKRSPLHAAAYKGDTELAELLLEQGARVNTKDSRWLTPLHRACGVSADDTVSLLLKHDADTSARDRQWQTPLHIAAANNAVECVSHLLGCISSINVTDRSGRTALHHAALNGHNDVVKLLISKGCIVNACDKKDCMPIHWAAHLGHVGTMELLIKNGADINVYDRNQYTPLHVAAASGMVYACHLLINSGANVDSANVFGNTPLHIACLNGHISVCDVLLAANVNLEAVNYRGQTPLHIAAASTDGIACMSFLLENHVDVNKQSLDGRTPLHMTAIHGRFTRSKTLIDHGAVIDVEDKNGNTALHIAAQNGHDILTATLLDYGADPNKRGYEGRTPLHLCCLSGFVEVARKFIQAKVDLNTQDNTGKTPTHYAAYNGSVECLDLLVSEGANFKLQDSFGRTALHNAAARGHYNCVFTLVGIGAPVNVHDSEGCTALHLAAAYDLEGRCVQYLLQHKSDPKLRDNRGFTAVHYAVNGCNEHALHNLLEALGKMYQFHGPDMPPNTPLHFAARRRDSNIMSSIMSYFPDTNIKNATGCTPLLIAAREGNAECVQMLLRYGAKVAICEDVYGMSPVHYAAKNGHNHCLALLVDNTEDTSIIDKPDIFNRTALMLAVSSSYTDCVLTLLKSKSDPNIVDSDKHSSLFRAIVTNQNSVAQLLITNGATILTPDINGKTVVHLAAACGNFSCLQTILYHIQPHEAALFDNHKFSALHWACYYGNASCVEYLLQRGVFKSVDGNIFSPAHCATFAGSERCLEILYKKFGKDIVNFKDERQRTPLHIAALNGHSDCARYLLEQGAEIDEKDENGRTPLIAASQYGQSEVIELLITYNPDFKQCDNNGNTALHSACLKHHCDAAFLLLNHISDVEIVNMTNKDLKTPLHLAARNGLIPVTNELIVKGSSVLAVDSEGLTPALCCAPNACVAKCLAIILANQPNHSIIKVSIPEKRTQNAQMQTKMSIMRDPRELLDVIFRDPNIASRKSRSRLRPSQNVSAPCLAHRRKYSTGGNLVLIENYDNTVHERPRRQPNYGLGLHRSFSEIALAPNEERDRIEKTAVNKLITGYKNVAKKMEALTKIYDVTYEDINNIYLHQQTMQNKLKGVMEKSSESITQKSQMLNVHIQEDGDFDGYTSKDDSESSRRRFYLMKKLGLLQHSEDESPIEAESIAIELENEQSKSQVQETASNENTSSITVQADDENIENFLEEESAVREERLVADETNLVNNDTDNSKEDTDECISDIALDAENELDVDGIKNEEEITDEEAPVKFVEIPNQEVQLEEIVENFSMLDLNENREDTNSHMAIETESTLDIDSAIDSQEVIEEETSILDTSLEEIKIVSNDEVLQNAAGETREAKKCEYFTVNFNEGVSMTKAAENIGDCSGSEEDCSDSKIWEGEISKRESGKGKRRTRRSDENKLPNSNPPTADGFDYGSTNHVAETCNDEGNSSDNEYF